MKLRNCFECFRLCRRGREGEGKCDGPARLKPLQVRSPPPPLSLSLVPVPSSSLRLYKAPCDTSSSAGKSTRSERERRGQLYPLHALTLFLRFYSAPSRLISRYRTSSSGDLIYLFSLVSGNNRSSTYATHVWVCVCAVQHTAATCVT